MSPEAITPDVVHDALRAIRSSKRLRASPLVDLVALGRRLTAEGQPDTREARVGLLPRWLEEVAWQQVARMREREPVERHGAPTTERLLALLAGDFQAHSLEREAWGILHFRYFSGSSLTILQLADQLGVADKTLRRRLDHGHQALADVLQDNERAATLGLRRGHAVPEELTSFVGREAELAEVRRLLAAHRLVVLTAPGGMGKSRLAVRLARDLAPDFADGAWFVDLSALLDGRQVPGAVATGLGLLEQRGRTATETLVDHLADKRLLLVLDNCELVIPVLSELLRAVLGRCPRVQVLATSREELYLDGQAVFPVPPMALPPEPAPAGNAQHFDAVRLFTRRAAAARPDFVVDDGGAAQVVRLCRQLDGIPLAIELAAARARMMTLDQIEARLSNRFGLLRDGRHASRPGHETMQAALDGSFELLSRPEQALFMRLSVFQGGWTLEAAEAVCSSDNVPEGDVLDLLAQLEAKSLIVAHHGVEQLRYRLLETLREYARDRMEEAGDSATWQERHASHFLALAEAAAPALGGPDQVLWLRRIEAEQANFHVALARWRTPATIERGLRLANALAPYWHARGRQGEGGVELASLMAVEGAGDAGAAYAEALSNAGRFAVTRFEPGVAEPLLLEALDRWRALAVVVGEGRALRYLGLAAERRSDLEAAGEYLETSITLLREQGETSELAYSMLAYATVCGWRGDAALGRSLLQEVTRMARAVGNWQLLADVLGNRGVEAIEDGDFDLAASLIRESQELKQAIGDRRGIAISLLNLGQVEVMRGHMAAGCRLMEESLGYWRDIGDRSGVSITLGGMGEAYLLAGELDEAAPRLEACLAVERELNVARLQRCLDVMARLELARGRPEHALWIVGAVAQSREETGFVAAPQPASEIASVEQAALATLGDDRAAKAIQDGRRLPLDEVAACVLRERPWRYETTVAA